MKSSLRKARPLPVAAYAAALAAVFASGCAVYDEPPPPTRVYVPVRPQVYPYAEPAVTSVYVEPPLSEPAPIAVPWAPPPMLMEVPSPMPFPGAVWVGGYWVWQGNWVWATGRWAPPPRPDYTWVHPYYEHRDGVVIFITGHWCPPGASFVPPPRGLRLNIMAASPGARPGYAPIGPPGVFLPPPPGSRPGLIVPAPMGTPPAVLRGAPPVVNVGMRIQNSGNDTHTTNVTNITNVTIVAPAGATLTGRPFNAAVQPNRPEPHQAVAMPPPPAPSSQEAPPPIVSMPRHRPDPMTPWASPASAPAWRGTPVQPAPVQGREHERGDPRGNGGRAVRMQDRAQERAQERMPVEPQRRQAPSAPTQANPVPVMQQPAPLRHEDRVRVGAPPARATAEGAAPPKRDEERRRQRPAGEKSDKDKKDPKGE